MPTIPELLAPAGTPAKLRTALHFGADAVYLGLRDYSLRAFAGNFDVDQLEWALEYAHERGRRVYVALNIQPFDEDFDGLEATARTLGKLRLRPDAVIVSDPGVLQMVRRVAPGLPLHLSTQASVTNARSARFWFDQEGLERIIVARELSLEQLGELVERSGGGDGGGGRGSGAIEAFVHGAVCIAYSGRCLLSLYWAKRDPRRGACAQGCRWRYTELVDSRRPDEPNPVAQDERGTYFFDAKDLCGLPVLDRLVATGVRALKIEGRSRSEHYLGVTVDVYRHALDLLAAGDNSGFTERQSAYLAELGRPTHRGFSTHFLTGEEAVPASYNPQGSYADGRYDFAGRVVAAESRYVDVELAIPLSPGTALELRDAGLLCERVTVSRLVTPQGELLEKGRSGDILRIAGDFRTGPGALVRLEQAESDSSTIK